MSTTNNKFQQIKTALDLDDEIDSTSVDISSDNITVDEISQALDHATELEKEFKKIDSFDAHDKEMDEIASLAKTSYEDLFEIASNTEIRYAAEIFAVSNNMLKLVLDAKNSKIDKKLKLLRLQIDKMRVDKMAAADNANTVNSSAVVLDRNEILKHIKDINNE